MESAPQRRLKLREIMRRPLCRHEMRMAIGPAAMVVLYVLAGLIDLAGLWALCSGELLDGSGTWLDPGASLIAAWAASGVTVLVAILLVPALMASAVAGERERGTLDALVLTPVDRYELVWAKLLGRTQPVRRFLLAAAPGCSAGVMVVVMHLTHGSADIADIAASGMAGVLWLVLLGAFGTAGFWALLAGQVFCLAGIALYVSARARRKLTAGLMAYAVLLAYITYTIGLMALSLAGPILLDRVVKKFDEYALKD